MKKHNLLSVVLISIFVACLCTWLFPTASFQGALIDGERAQMGLFDIFTYPTLTLSFFGYLAIFILAVGGFYGVMYKIPSYRKLLDKIVDGFKGRENIFLIVVMVLFALLTSICGLSVGLMFLFPLVISVVLLMGYDKMVAASVTVGSVVIGLMGSLYSRDLAVINSILAMDYNEEILTKIIVLLLGLVLLIFNTLAYAKKTKAKKAPKAEELEGYVPASVRGKKKIWPIVVIIDVVLVVMILAFTAWQDAFDLAIFTKTTKAVMDFKIFKFPVFAKVLGTIAVFEKWTLTELAILIVFATLIISLIAKLKLSDVVDSFVEGTKKALKPTILMLLVYTILIIAVYNPFQLKLYEWILGITKGFNVLTTTVVAFISSVFNVELTYAASSSMPYLITLTNATKYYPIISIIYQSMYGLAMLIGPTSVILIGTLAYLDIPYTKWVKHIWKLVVELLVVMLIVFAILWLI